MPGVALASLLRLQWQSQWNHARINQWNTLYVKSMPDAWMPKCEQQLVTVDLAPGRPHRTDSFPGYAHWPLSKSGSLRTSSTQGNPQFSHREHWSPKQRIDWMMAYKQHQSNEALLRTHVINSNGPPHNFVGDFVLTVWHVTLKTFWCKIVKPFCDTETLVVHLKSTRVLSQRVPFSLCRQPSWHPNQCLFRLHGS